MVMMAISSRASGCWDSLGCPYGIFFERDPWKRTKIRAVLDRISTGSRTRVPGSRLNGGNPPLVSPMGLVWHQSPPYIPFSFSSTPHRGRSPCGKYSSQTEVKSRWGEKEERERAGVLIETQPSRFVRHTRRCEAEFPVPISDAGGCETKKNDSPPREKKGGPKFPRATKCHVRSGKMSPQN